jgi:hypothetical protein
VTDDEWLRHIDRQIAHLEHIIAVDEAFIGCSLCLVVGIDAVGIGFIIGSILFS